MPPPESVPSPPGNRWRKVLIAAMFVAAIALFFALGGPQVVSLDWVKAHRDALLAFTQQHFVAALAIAFGVYAGAIAFSLPVGLLLSLTMGFLFGRWIGTALVIVAATVGATLVFLATRYMFADVARRWMGPLGEKLNAGFTANAFHYLLFLRLMPGFPFFLVNLAPGLTDIPVRTFVLATLIGIAPATFVFVNLGQTLGRIDSLAGLVSVETLGALALLALIALTPVAWKRYESGKARNA